jgi:hypothetical protein
VAYDIELDEAVWGHLRYLTARERTIVVTSLGTVRIIGIGRKRGNVVIMGDKETPLWNT